MTRRLALVLRTLLLPAALLCIVQIGAAEEAARSFAGTYQLSNVVEEGGQVHLTMTVTLKNPGDTDIKGGIIAVLTSEPAPALIGSFNPIGTLFHLKQTTVSHSLTLSSAEYASWQNGHAPRLQFLIPSGDTAIAASIQAFQVAAPVKAN